VKEELKGCGIQFDSALATTFNFLKRNEFSGISGGLSMRARAPKRPTIGLTQIGSVARDRDAVASRVAASWPTENLEFATPSISNAFTQLLHSLLSRQNFGPA